MIRRPLLALGLLWAVVAGQVHASDEEPGERVRVEVTAIHASMRGDDVDPRLEGLRRELAAFDFTAFRLLSEERVRVAFGESREVSLPGERTLTVAPKRRDAAGRLRIRLTLGEALDTTYAIAEGASLMVGGPRHDGGHLVLAVTQSAADE